MLRDGTEDGSCDENWVSLRMLSLCYDLRHARPSYQQQTDDSSSEAPSPIQGQILAFPGCEAVTTIQPDEDDPDDDEEEEIYEDLFEVRILWPEAIFAAFILNHYLGTYLLSPMRKKQRSLNQMVSWAVVRKFQLQIIDCLCSVVNPKKEKGLRTLFHDEYNQPDADYCTLYIEQLTVDFVRESSEKRLHELGLIPSRIIKKNGAYYLFSDTIHERALREGREPWGYHIADTFPEDIDW